MPGGLTQTVPGAGGVALGQRLIGISLITILQSLAQGERLSDSISRPKPNRAVQDVVSMQDERASAVAMFDGIAGCVKDSAPEARVNAFGAQWVFGKIVDMLKGDTP